MAFDFGELPPQRESAAHSRTSPSINRILTENNEARTRLADPLSGSSSQSNFNLSNERAPSSATSIDFSSHDSSSGNTGRWPLFPNPMNSGNTNSLALQASKSLFVGHDSTGYDSNSDKPLQSLPNTAEPESLSPSVASLIQKLSDTNVKLFQHSATIPPVIESSPNLSEALGNQEKDGNTSSTSHSLLYFGQEFAIDQTFLLSQQLIDILNELFPRFLKNSSLREQSRTPLLMQSPSSSPRASSNTNQTPTTDANPFASYLDQGSILLVLSCYMRVIDIYDKICGHIRNCVSDTSPAAKATQLTLPGLSIGGFSLHKSPAMKIMLMLQLAEQLLDCIRDIVGLVGSPTSISGNFRRGGASIGDVTDVTLQAIRLKDAEMAKKMAQVRALLPQSGLV